MLNKKVYSEKQKEEFLEEFKTCKESQRVFCQRVGIGRTTLKRWLAETKEATSTKETTETTETTEFGIIHLNTDKEELGVIHFKTDDIEIKLKSGYDKVMLQKIFEVLAYAK